MTMTQPFDGPDRRGARTTFAALSAIVALGLGLRAYHLDSHFFWYDEALILNAFDIGLPVIEYTKKVWAETTYNPGWPLIVWECVHHIESSLRAARLPSCAAGVLAIASVFWACRALRLDRTTALIAALFTALSWTQIDYSQQVLPYSTVPFLAAVCLALLGRIDQNRSTNAAGRGRLARLHLALLGACVTFVAIHNSFLLLLPMLGVFLGLSLIWPIASGSEDVATDSRAFGYRASLSAVTLVLITIASGFFFLPKQREGFRDYLGSYYPATFLNSEYSFKYTLDVADRWYRSAIPPSSGGNALYFFSSRVLDGLTFLLSPRYSLRGASDFYYLAATMTPLIALFCVGLVCLGRGKGGRTATLAVVSGLVVVVFTGLLSLARMYPFGGVRQLLPMAPWVAVVTAVGARQLLGARPRASVALAVGYVAMALTSAPDYYSGTRQVLGKHQLVALARQAGTSTIVTGDGLLSALPLKYLAGDVRDGELFPPYHEHFGALLRSNRPFLFISLKEPLLSETPEGWSLIPDLRPFWPEEHGLDHYTVEPLMVRPGAPSVQGAYVYAIKPRLKSIASVEK